ncbi:hypothetical protein [Actinoplanes aureus]|uniref:Secreted protein n=1 Tax=Actinoplanes aureus TaxID=2792083 RepID=A0A931G1U3_9ACTN|nr:hypothetical protein [Actinoplanes aureus]MBG0562664.1 hypothetical protein [Actinoplanes aureus]
MRTSVKLGAYALGLVVVFGATAGAGRVFGPEEKPAPPPAHTEAHAEPAAESAAAHVPGGLQVAQDGYRLTLITTSLTTGDAQPFRFRVLGPDGEPVTAYTTNHDKDLHLIVVRRDLSGFQHVHPTLGTDGTWSIPLAVDTPGQYRVFADFQPAARDEGLTLGVDVPAPGDYQPRPLPVPARTAEVDGYTVTLAGDLTAGASAQLTLSVSRDGQPVVPEPYLGASGHLVALRDGDLAYLHVHPTDEKSLSFAAEVPSAGVYRLYLDFKHDGKVRTAEFTATTSGVVVPQPQATEPAHDADGHTHD